MLEVSASWAALALAGILIHLFADWFLQNDWMAANKAKKADPNSGRGWGLLAAFADPLNLGCQPWYYRHVAAFVHAGIHTVLLLLVFPIWAALVIGTLHLIIDTRSPLDWWGKFSRQTRHDPNVEFPVMDIGMEVAFWRDQVAHFVVIALVAIGC